MRKVILLFSFLMFMVLPTVQAFELPVAKFIQPTELSLITLGGKKMCAIRATWYIESGDPKLITAGIFIPSMPNTMLTIPNDWNGFGPVVLPSQYQVNKGDKVIFVLVAPNPSDSHQNALLDQWEQVVQ